MTGKIVTIQKTTQAEAIQVNSPEEEATVRLWLTEMFELQIDGIERVQAEDLARAQEISPVIEAKAWFARDKGDKTLYLIPPEDFVLMYEELAEEDIDPVQFEEETHPFKF